MCVLVGKSCAGKTSLVRMLASLLGVSLVEFSVNNSTDTSDLLGGFEKVKPTKSRIVSTYDLLKTSFQRALTPSHHPGPAHAASSLVHLTRAYFSFLFESHRLFELIAADDFTTACDENRRDVTECALSLFQRNLEILLAFESNCGKSRLSQLARF